MSFTLIELKYCEIIICSINELHINLINNVGNKEINEIIFPYRIIGSFNYV